MKTLQKYANMALLLFSVATMFPTYANPTMNEQENVKQEEIMVETQKTETVWHKRPEVRKKIETVLTIGAFSAIYAFIGYMIFKYGIFGPTQQDPFDIRLMNANMEVEKLRQDYNCFLQMNEATVWELPTTHKNDFLKTVTAAYNKYGIRSKNRLYTLNDKSSLLRTTIW